MKLLNSNDYVLCQVSMGCNVPNKNGDIYDYKYLEDFAAKRRSIKTKIEGDYVIIFWEPEITLNYIKLDIVL